MRVRAGRTVLPAKALVLSALAVMALAGEARASSFVLRSTIDALMQQGDTDLRGDHKRISGIYRDFDWAFGFSASIATPQADGGKRQYDTGRASVIVGREFAEFAIYGELGATNGGVLSSGQSLVAAMHQLAGGKGTRTSPASSGLKPLAGLILRRDFAWTGMSGDSGEGPADGATPARGACDIWCLGATATPFARIGNAEVSFGVAAFAVAQFGGRSLARQDVPGLPTLPVETSYLRLGVLAKAYGYRSETAAVGTRRGQVSALAGAGFSAAGWGGAVDVDVPLLAEVEGARELPVPLVTARLSRMF